jgi:hypothetical protein
LQPLFRGSIAVLLAIGMVASLAAAPTAVIAPAGAVSNPESPNLVGNRTEPKLPEAADRLPPANPLWAIPLNALSATRERPIFLPSRRPPAPEVATASAQTPQPQPTATPIEPERPQLVLVGTVANETASIGVFLDQSTNRMIRLRKGEDQKGWILRDVYRREVILVKDNQTVLLALPLRSAAPTAAPPVVASQIEPTRRDRR